MATAAAGLADAGTAEWQHGAAWSPPLSCDGNCDHSQAMSAPAVTARAGAVDVGGAASQHSLGGAEHVAGASGAVPDSLGGGGPLSRAGETLVRSGGSAPQEVAANAAVIDTRAADSTGVQGGGTAAAAADEAVPYAGGQGTGADASAADVSLRVGAASTDSAGALDGFEAEAAAADQDMADSVAAADSAAASESDGSRDNSPESAGGGEIGSAERLRRTRRTLLPKVRGRSC